MTKMISSAEVFPLRKHLSIKGKSFWDAWASEFGTDTDVTIQTLVERVMNTVGLQAAWVVAWELQSGQRRRAALRKMFERLAAVEGSSGLATRAAQAQDGASAFDWAALSVDARQAAREMVAANDLKAAIVWAVEAACHDPALTTARAGITAREYLSREAGEVEMTSQIMDLIRE